MVLGQTLQQTAHLEHLQEQMGNLQQVVKGLHHVRVDAVGVFKVQTAVLLDVKALVFNVAAPPALAGQGTDILVMDAQVGHPGEGLAAVGAGFFTDQSMDGVNAAILALVLEVVDPAKGLAGFIGQTDHAAVFRGEFEQALKVLPQRGGAPLFKGQDERPLIVLADGHDRSAGIERISADAKAGLGELLFEIGGQPAKGFEFAILFNTFISGQSGQIRKLGCAGWVLDKLRGHRDGQAAGVHQFGFQDGVEIGGVSFMPMHQAMRAVRLPEGQKTSAIDHDWQTAFQTTAIEELVTDELAHTLGPQVREGIRADMAQEMAQGFVDGQGSLLGLSQPVDIVQHLEVEVAQGEIQLAAAAQF